MATGSYRGTQGRHFDYSERYVRCPNASLLGFGTWKASVGDWIIQGVKGELYPCKPDIFEATYEPA